MRNLFLDQFDSTTLQEAYLELKLNDGLKVFTLLLIKEIWEQFLDTNW